MRGSGLAVDFTIPPAGPGVLGVEGPGRGAGVFGTRAEGPGVDNPANAGGAVFLPFLLINGIVAGEGLLLAAGGAGGAGDGDALDLAGDSLSLGLEVLGIVPVSFASALTLLLACAVKYPAFSDRGIIPGS